MSTEICRGCGRRIHDVEEHIEAYPECAIEYPEIDFTLFE